MQVSKPVTVKAVVLLHKSVPTPSSSPSGDWVIFDGYRSEVYLQTCYQHSAIISSERRTLMSESTAEAGQNSITFLAGRKVVRA